MACTYCWTQQRDKINFRHLCIPDSSTYGSYIIPMRVQVLSTLRQNIAGKNYSQMEEHFHGSNESIRHFEPHFGK